jgi:hypothetical protein
MSRSSLPFGAAGQQAALLGVLAFRRALGNFETMPPQVAASTGVADERE